jgi:hypothetical protein
MMSGEVMKKMHEKVKSPKFSPATTYTYKLAEAQMGVMDLLKMMPAVSMRLMPLGI